MNRSRFLRGAAGLALLSPFTLAMGQASDAAWPSRTVTMVVPVPPGSSTDILARLIAEKLAGRLNQNFVVENRPGASGLVGAGQVARAAPDGHTLALVPSTLFIAPHVMPKGSGGGVDVVKDLTPVIRTGFSPMVVLAHPSLGVKNLNELVAHVKQKPGLPYATSGNGSPMHIAGEVFQHATGIKMTHVPYKGVMPAVQDTVAGNVQLAISALGGVGQFISAGRLVPLAVIGPRTSLLPNVPTVQQQGITGLDVGPPWFPILAPAGTPAAIVNRLNQEVNAVLRLPDVREKLLGAGVEPQGGTVEEAQRDVREDHARYGRVVTQFQIKGE